MKLLFEFSGGSRDGQTDVGDDAHKHYWVSGKGTIGKSFWIATPHSMNQLGSETARESGNLRAERYQVIERLDAGDEMLVRCKFIGYEGDVDGGSARPS